MLTLSEVRIPRSGGELEFGARKGETVVIEVRLIKEQDAEYLLSLELRNMEFFQLYTGKRDEHFYTLDGQRERIERAIASAAEDTGYYFVILLNGNIIGIIMLSEVVRWNLQSSWIGYFLDKEQNGKGYMTEAVRQVVAIAFDELEFHRLEAGVMPHNIGSIKVLLKAGFHKEGIAKQNVKINGKWQDHQTLAIINPRDLM
ncbi:RimJ/RimL family protein N-acetyltransferase [Terribacillus saccharophilus]|uniref:RimJ/RimL family protein N-acetyltransferase n=1 Tax=Terribacillus saccharophilus TaxID=361277 RepID=A0A268AAQ4_9BACI|nr:RimJ/RimL family protein N-acetyltransferase [Terribacillus saccharophilus]PAF36004.1 RimJ/RimL family protein N-acetyltransferase [Terribacillus saccharophilus]